MSGTQNFKHTYFCSQPLIAPQTERTCRCHISNQSWLFPSRTTWAFVDLQLPPETWITLQLLKLLGNDVHKPFTIPGLANQGFQRDYTHVHWFSLFWMKSRFSDTLLAEENGNLQNTNKMFFGSCLIVWFFVICFCYMRTVHGIASEWFWQAVKQSCISLAVNDAMCRKIVHDGPSQNMQAFPTKLLLWKKANPQLGRFLLDFPLWRTVLFECISMTLTIREASERRWVLQRVAAIRRTNRTSLGHGTRRNSFLGHVSARIRRSQLRQTKSQYRYYKQGCTVIRSNNVTTPTLEMPDGDITTHLTAAQVNSRRGAITSFDIENEVQNWHILIQWLKQFAPQRQKTWNKLGESEQQHFTTLCVSE